MNCELCGEILGSNASYCEWCASYRECADEFDELHEPEAMLPESIFDDMPAAAQFAGKENL